MVFRKYKFCYNLHGTSSFWKLLYVDDLSDFYHLQMYVPEYAYLIHWNRHRFYRICCKKTYFAQCDF